MALVFCDGYDAADFSTKWSYISGFVNSTTTRFSTGRSISGGGGDSCAKDIAPIATAIVGVAIRYGGGVNTPFFGTGSDSGTVNQIFIVRNITNGFLEIRRSGFNGTLLATGSYALLSGVWNYIEAKVVISDTVGTVEVRINGSTTPDVTYSGDTRNGGTSTNIDRVWIGGGSITGATGSSQFDDMYVCDTTGSSNNDFLGDIRIHTLVPSGNGNSSQLTGSDGDATDNYQLVDEIPYSTADYVGTATPGLKDTYVMSDVPASTTGIFGVQNNIIAGKTDASLATAKSVLRVSGTDYSGTAHPLATSFQSFRDVYNTNPASSTAWTVSDVNNLESGTEVG